MSDLASQKSCWRPKKALQYSWGSGGGESVVGDVDSLPVLFAWSACTAVVLLVVLGDMVVDGIDVDFSSFSFERLDDVVFNGKVARSDGSVTLWNPLTSSELFVVFACCRNSSKSAVKLFLASAFKWDFALEVLLHSPPNVIDDIKTTKDNPRTATESNYISGREKYIHIFRVSVGENKIFNGKFPIKTFLTAEKNALVFKRQGRAIFTK